MQGLDNIETAPAYLVSAPAAGLYADMVFGTVGALALLWVVVVARREKDWVPLLLFLGGALVVAYEPIVDVLGRIVYPLNYKYRFVSFGRDLPLWLFPPYMGFLGIIPYHVALYMQKEDARKEVLYLVAAATFAGVFVTDYIVAGTGHYLYYGSGFLHTLAGSLVMGAYPLASGYALHLLRSHKGAVAMLATFFLPSVAFGAGFAATSFPLCFALNSELSAPMDVFFRLLSVVQTVGVVWLMAGLATQKVGRFA